MRRDNYLREWTVPIPWDQGNIVIRKGDTVEYQLDRTYEPEDKSTRVQRKVIGKVDPVQAGRMFPNEVVVPFKVERINEVLSTLRGAFPSDATPPNPYGYLRLIEEGLTYSDVLLMLKWYKVLPR